MSPVGLESELVQTSETHRWKGANDQLLIRDDLLEKND